MPFMAARSHPRPEGRGFTPCQDKEDEATFSSDLTTLFLQHGKDETVVEPVSKMLSYEQEIIFNKDMNFEQFLLLFFCKKTS